MLTYEQWGQRAGSRCTGNGRIRFTGLDPAERYGIFATWKGRILYLTGLTVGDEEIPARLVRGGTITGVLTDSELPPNSPVDLTLTGPGFAITLVGHVGERFVFHPVPEGEWILTAGCLWEDVYRKTSKKVSTGEDIEFRLDK